MDILEQAYRELQKSLQKTHVKSNALFVMDSSSKDQKKVRVQSKTETEQTKTTLSHASKTLAGTIQGSFGEKLTQVLEEQEQFLADF